MASGRSSGKIKKMQLSLPCVGTERSPVVSKRAGEVNALVSSDSILVNRADVSWIASETSRMLDGLSRDVRECKNVIVLPSQAMRMRSFSFFTSQVAQYITT